MSEASGTLTTDICVNEWMYTKDGKTHIRLEFGNSCYMNFVVPERVEVPKYIQFKAQLNIPQ